MAIIRKRKIGPANIDGDDTCCRGVTIEQAEKIMEDMYNLSCIYRSRGITVKVTGEGEIVEAPADETA